MNQKPIILFDMDGTLIDASVAIRASFREAFLRHGMNPPEEAAIDSMIGLPLPEMFRKSEVPPHRIPAFVSIYREEFRNLGPLHTHLLPGAGEAVEQASRFARLGVVTTKTARYTRILLEQLGLHSSFEAVVGYEDVIHPKPHPEPLWLALHRMGVEESPGEERDRFLQERCWMVGDTSMDLEAALAAGVGAVGVLCGFGDLRAYQEEGRVPLHRNTKEAVTWIERTVREEKREPSPVS